MLFYALFGFGQYADLFRETIVKYGGKYLLRASTYFMLAMVSALFTYQSRRANQ